MLFFFFISSVIIIIGLTIILLLYKRSILPVINGQKFLDDAIQIKDGFTSAFLLDAGLDKFVLIDAGQDKNAKAIIAALNERKMRPENVIAILLTHGHHDHIGGVSAFPNAKLMSMADDVSLVECCEPSLSRIGRWFGARSTGLHIDHVLKNGEALTLGNLQIQAYAVPGHTIGSAAFFCNGVLYLGDNANSLTDGSMRPTFKFISENADLNVRSLNYLKVQLESMNNEIKFLTFSHSGALKGFKPFIDFANKYH